MHSNRPSLAATAVLAALALSVLAFGAIAPAGAAAATCAPATNVEAIVDDSQSMIWNDPNGLRVQGMKLLISKAGMKNKRLGAIEFGSTAGTLFAPDLVAGHESAMNAALDANLTANSPSTNYTIAFQQANTDNPTADARIFLTDGAHNIGTYANAHLPGPATHVIGLGADIPAADQARLQQIASDTGGTYQQVNNGADVQAAINAVDAYLNCQTTPLLFTDTFTSLSQTKSHSARISSSIRSADLVLTWSSPLDEFDLSSIKLKTSKGTISSIAKRARLKIKRTRGTTYLNVHVRGLKRGKLIFKLKLRKSGSGQAAGVALTTQLSRSSRR